MYFIYKSLFLVSVLCTRCYFMYCKSLLLSVLCIGRLFMWDKPLFLSVICTGCFYMWDEPPLFSVLCTGYCFMWITLLWWWFLEAISSSLSGLNNQSWQVKYIIWYFDTSRIVTYNLLLLSLFVCSLILWNIAKWFLPHRHSWLCGYCFHPSWAGGSSGGWAGGRRLPLCPG